MKKFLLASAFFVAFAPTAQAYTWQVQACADLYMQRNRFYDDKGLCFTRPTAREFFPNNRYSCTIRDARDLEISAREKAWVDNIVAHERALGCPRI